MKSEECKPHPEDLAKKLHKMPWLKQPSINITKRVVDGKCLKSLPKKEDGDYFSGFKQKNHANHQRSKLMTDTTSDIDIVRQNDTASQSNVWNNNIHISNKSFPNPATEQIRVAKEQKDLDMAIEASIITAQLEAQKTPCIAEIGALKIIDDNSDDEWGNVHRNLPDSPRSKENTQHQIKEGFETKGKHIFVDKYGRVNGYTEKHLFMGKGARLKEQQFLQSLKSKTINFQSTSSLKLMQENKLFESNKKKEHNMQKSDNHAKAYYTISFVNSDIQAKKNISSRENRNECKCNTEVDNKKCKCYQEVKKGCKVASNCNGLNQSNINSKGDKNCHRQLSNTLSLKDVECYIKIPITKQNKKNEQLKYNDIAETCSTEFQYRQAARGKEKTFGNVMNDECLLRRKTFTVGGSTFKKYTLDQNLKVHKKQFKENTRNELQQDKKMAKELILYDDNFEKHFSKSTDYKLDPTIAMKRDVKNESVLTSDVSHMKLLSLNKEKSWKNHQDYKWKSDTRYSFENSKTENNRYGEKNGVENLAINERQNQVKRNKQHENTECDSEKKSLSKNENQTIESYPKVIQFDTNSNISKTNNSNYSIKQPIEELCKIPKKEFFSNTDDSHYTDIVPGNCTLNSNNTNCVSNQGNMPIPQLQNDNSLGTQFQNFMNVADKVLNPSITYNINNLPKEPQIGQSSLCNTSYIELPLQQNSMPQICSPHSTVIRSIPSSSIEYREQTLQGSNIQWVPIPSTQNTSFYATQAQNMNMYTHNTEPFLSSFTNVNVPNISHNNILGSHEMYHYIPTQMMYSQMSQLSLPDNFSKPSVNNDSITMKSTETICPVNNLSIRQNRIYQQVPNNWRNSDPMQYSSEYGAAQEIEQSDNNFVDWYENIPKNVHSNQIVNYTPQPGSGRYYNLNFPNNGTSKLCLSRNNSSAKNFKLTIVSGLPSECDNNKSGCTNRPIISPRECMEAVQGKFKTTNLKCPSPENGNHQKTNFSKPIRKTGIGRGKFL